MMNSFSNQNRKRETIMPSILTINTTEKKVVSKDYDLSILPIKEWPQELRDQITPSIIARAKNDLFPKDKLIELVIRSYKSMLTFDTLFE